MSKWAMNNGKAAVRRYLNAIMLMAVSWGMSLSVNAACPAPAEDTDVAVGIRLAPPFVTQDSIRGQRGFALELWQSIERELQRDGVIGNTELIECPLSAQLAALAAGELDMVISPLTITTERMAAVDFSHQYLGSGITVAQRSGDVIDFGYATRILADTVMQPGVPRVILIFLVLNLLLAGLVSLSLKSHVAFVGTISHEPRLLRLLRTAIETVTRTTGLQGTSSDFRSTLGKSLDVVMAVIGTLLSATIFGVLTAALIGSIGANRDVSLSDLPTLRLATLANSTSHAFLEQLTSSQMSDDGGLIFAGAEEENDIVLGRRRVSAAASGSAVPQSVALPTQFDGVECMPADQADGQARCITTDSWTDAMQMLAAGDVDAVLGDWAQLSYLARLPAFGNGLHVQSAAFRNEPYGWGINPQRPELRTAINQALMERIRNPQWRYLVQEYLGRGSIGSN